MAAFLTGISAISSRVKRKIKNTTSSPESRAGGTPAKPPPSQTTSPVQSSCGFSSSSSGFAAASSSSGSESPPRLKRVASSPRRGVLIWLERMVTKKTTKQDLKGKGVEEESGDVEFILFDGEGNPASYKYKIK